MELDSQIERLRAETPGCGTLAHFNNAGCALTPQPVMAGLVGHLNLEQEAGGYEAADLAAGRIDNFYRAFASLLNCRSDEIAFVENATRAWDMVFYAIPFQPGDRVITGQAEYASNYLAMLQLQQRRGITIDIIPDNASGTLCLDTLKNRISPRTRLIAITHIASQVGTVQPAAQVGEIARDNDILFLLDACQSAGQLPLDTQTLHCDLLTGTGRKYLRGPRGTGFLYVNQDVLHRLEPPFIDLHSAHWIDRESYRFRPDARRFENWECFVAGKIALGVAADYARELGLARIQTRIAQLVSQLRKNLAAMPGTTVYENTANCSGIVTFSSSGEDPVTLQQRLRRAGINTSVAKRANAVVDTELRQVGDVNRASLHYYNTADEIERFVDVLSSRR